MLRPDADAGRTRNLAADDLFTVIIRLDARLVIHEVSPLITLRAPDVAVNSRLLDVCDFIRPRKISPKSLPDQLGMIVLIISHESRYPMRGQLVQSDDGYLLVGAPWLARMVSDGIHEYDFKDFPAHDAQLDWLFLLSAEQQQVSDLKLLSEEVSAAKTEIERANEAKSAFFAMMSHEMRTPLNAVIGAIQLLGDEQLKAPQTELLDMAARGSEHLLTVINDVLDFSKIEAGKMVVENASFSPYRLIDDLRSICQSRALAKGLDFVTDVEESVPALLEGDHAKITQVLINLVGNAIKFTAVGMVKVTASTTFNDETAVILRLEVEDTGCGISEENKTKLFTGFWTTPNQKYHVEGTGLGLDISRRLTELMAGTIAFDSTENQGSRFWIEIPVTVLDTGPAVQETASNEEQRFPNHRVLLAEDNQANQLIFKLNLKRLGLSVELANDGLEAIDMVRNHEYDIILMDLGMPEVDGAEATKVIRGELNSTVPIIACTAHAGDELHKQLAGGGFSDYVTKPLDRNQLFTVLQRWLPRGASEEGVDSVAVQKNALANIFNETTFNNLLNEVGVANKRAIIDAALNEIQQRVSRICAACEEGDFDAVRSNAHALKSTAFSYGAESLGQLLTEIENLAGSDRDRVLTKTAELQASRKHIESVLCEL